MKKEWSDIVICGQMWSDEVICGHMWSYLQSNETYCKKIYCQNNYLKIF